MSEEDFEFPPGNEAFDSAELRLTVWNFNAEVSPNGQICLHINTYREREGDCWDLRLDLSVEQAEELESLLWHTRRS